ncbi:MAG: class I SAM-dependent methyltransferase [Clostridia bacterium]|nr:class I SAM-dependent methyltransferase [Clostridia bacterium]
MNDMYFARTPGSASRPERFETVFEGVPMTFWTDAGVFSKGEIDRGSLTLLKAVPKDLSGRILDLGCGWGLIGTVIGKTRRDVRVVMCDVNERAVELSRRNLKENGVDGEVILSDGFTSLDGTFDAVVTNPPIRAGKSVIYRLFKEAAERLSQEGRMYLVIRRQQGAESALKYLNTVFLEAKAVDKSGGFWVIACSGKRSVD